MFHSSTAWSRLFGAAPWTFLVAAALLPGCASTPERRFHAHVKYLASDKLEGRGVGSRGLDLAADYIAEQFHAIGLAAAGDAGTYFQTFPIALQRTLTDESRLALTGADDLLQGRDFIPFSFSSDEAFSGGVVFCGYGIVAPEKGYDDFVGVDLEGRVALMLRGEPVDWADEDNGPTRHAMFRNKVYNAKDRGAVAVLIVNPTPRPDEADELMPFVGESADEYGIPAFQVTRAVVDGRLAAAGLDSLSPLQEGLDAGHAGSAVLAHISASGKAEFKKATAPTSNVLAVLHGDGPLAEEFVVVCAHYDHLGLQRPMMRKFKAGKLVQDVADPQIHNGADDNASGVAGLIESARLLAGEGGTRRSVLFAAFTAEETGLQGSKYYVEHPAVPLEKTIAVLNMDMIGRMKPEEWSVQVFGTECGSDFAEMLEDYSRRNGLEIASIPDPGGNSDHASFVRREIPALHFFTGHHGDYHKPSDDAEKINAEGGVRVTRLVHDCASTLATRERRPVFKAVKRAQEDRATGTPTYRVVMGLAPGYVDDGKPGMTVDAVNPDGPADLAGMKAGDRIVRIGDKPVANIYDYMAATRNNGPGDTVEVVVLRNGSEQTLQVTLASAR